MRHVARTLRQAGLLAAALVALAAAAHAAPSIGQEPLSDRAPGEFYLDPVLGEPGLFPGGANVPTGSHLAYGQGKLLALVPRDGAGNPSPTGWIGLLSVGMSNTNQEWSRWERTADGAAAHSGRVVLVDAALGGVDATRMANPADVYWSSFDSRLQSAAVTPQQVQAVWLKQHLLGPYPQPTFTAGVDDLKTKIEAIVGILRNRLPNLQVVYFSSRIYAGHGNNVQEPFAFEAAFAVKRAIADQIAGVGDLGTGPWLTWGPYLWADGVVPRADGLTWLQSDIEGDGTHPTLSGEIKVASLLAGFFGADPHAARWYGPGVGPGVVVRDAAADAYVDSADPSAAHGLEPVLDLTGTRPVHARFDLTGLPTTPLVRAKLSLLADPDQGIGGGAVFLAASSGWDEATITAANAPAASGPALRTWTGWSRGAALSADVTVAVQNALAAGAPSIGFVLTTSVMMNSRAVAREGGDAPRLVLVFDGGELFDDGFELGTGAAWAGAAP
jgi:hypothetical protein